MEEIMAAIDCSSQKFGTRLGLALLVSLRQHRSYRCTYLKNAKQVRYFTVAFKKIIAAYKSILEGTMLVSEQARAVPCFVNSLL